MMLEIRPISQMARNIFALDLCLDIKLKCSVGGAQACLGPLDAVAVLDYRAEYPHLDQDEHE